MATQIGEIKLYSLKELSETFKVTVETLRRYLATGRLKGRKMGVRWFIPEDSLKEYFEIFRPEIKREVTLQGITEGSTVTDKDIEEVKGIWR